MTPPRGPTALVVDDCAAARRQLGLALSRLGVSTVEAEDGAAAWRKLQGERLDLIVTDIEMPVMDGLKLIGLVRKTARHRRTPILVVSSQATGPEGERARELGAAAYLPKPVQLPRLAEVVRQLLAQR